MAQIQARFRLDRPAFSLDVDLTLPARGVTALFGPSGSGKTTFLRCVAGLERATPGFFAIDGEVWQDANRWLPTHHRPLSYVFQEASLFPHLTVLGNLRYGMRRVKAAQQVNLDYVIELLGIGHLLDRRSGSLSGGERSRVAIARALAVSPRILLMDEPLASLDLKRKQEIVPYLERLHDELEIPILYVSHAPDEVARLADHLVVLEEGRAVAHGPLRDTSVRFDLLKRLGEDVGAVLDAKVGAIDDVWHLARMDFDGGSFWTPDRALPVGRAVRVRVLARDVSLARDPSARSSIQNVLRGRVEAVADDEHASLSLARVQVGNATLVARLTKRALAELDVKIGQEIWVQVKSVALMD